MALHSTAVSLQKGHTQVTRAMMGDLPHTPIIEHCVTQFDLCTMFQGEISKTMCIAIFMHAI